MRTMLFVSIIFVTTLLGCSGTEQLRHKGKLLPKTEISKLNSILKEITDTLHIRIPSEYNHETYRDLPDNMKNRLQKALINQGFPIRADSAYALGIRQAINNIKIAKLIKKKYGLERNVTLEDGSSWSADIEIDTSGRAPEIGYYEYLFDIGNNSSDTLEAVFLKKYNGCDLPPVTFIPSEITKYEYFILPGN